MANSFTSAVADQELSSHRSLPSLVESWKEEMTDLAMPFEHEQMKHFFEDQWLLQRGDVKNHKGINLTAKKVDQVPKVLRGAKKVLKVELNQVCLECNSDWWIWSYSDEVLLGRKTSMVDRRIRKKKNVDKMYGQWKLAGSWASFDQKNMIFVHTDLWPPAAGEYLPILKFTSQMPVKRPRMPVHLPIKDYTLRSHIRWVSPSGLSCCFDGVNRLRQ